MRDLIFPLLLSTFLTVSEADRADSAPYKGLFVPFKKCKGCEILSKAFTVAYNSIKQCAVM